MMEDCHISLLGLTLDELIKAVEELGMQKFVGKQIAYWLYKAHVNSIEEMTNISKANRAILSKQFCIGNKEYANVQESKDGTKKYLFPVKGSKFVETVYIPDGERATLCVSCQVGCKMNCLFCQTGKQGFEGSLTSNEILNQIYSLPEREALTNIVFMGQGEPMDNLENVLKAIKVLTETWGYAWSPRRITVSSVGIKNKLERFIKESECHLAISLHSPIHEQRAKLMPAEKAMPISEVISMIKESKKWNKKHEHETQRRLSFEYIVFDGLNDSQTHAREIVKLLEGLNCRINLIRFHQIPGIELKTSNEKKLETLRDYLTKHGIFTTIRASRGQDIFAACGLLSTKNKQAELLYL